MDRTGGYPRGEEIAAVMAALGLSSGSAFGLAAFARALDGDEVRAREAMDFLCQAGLAARDGEDRYRPVRTGAAARLHLGLEEGTEDGMRLLMEAAASDGPVDVSSHPGAGWTAALAAASLVGVMNGPGARQRAWITDRGRKAAFALAALRDGPEAESAPAMR